MWVMFVVLEAAIVVGGILLGVFASKLGDWRFVRWEMKHLDEEYRTLTASRRSF